MVARFSLDFWRDLWIFNRHKSKKGYIIFLMHNFAINNRYLYDRMTFVKKKHRYQQNSF